MEILLLLTLTAVGLWAVFASPLIGEWIERRLFVPIFKRYQLDGGQVEMVGEIIRRDGTRLPFGLTEAVQLTGEAVADAMRKSMPSRSAWGRMRGAVTHPTSVRNTVADAVVDLIDAGAGAGTIQFQTSGDVEVATLTYSDPAYGAAAAGTATANSITSDTNATGGTVAKSRHYDSNTTEVFATAVGTSGSDINLSSLAVGSGDTVSMSSLTYSAPN